MTLQATYRAAVIWQYEDLEVPDQWHNFGYAHDLGTLVRTRRFALPPRQSVTARRWRLIKIGGPDYGASRFQWDGFRFFVETAELSPARVFGFSFDDGPQTYMMVRTDRNIEVYRGDQRMASIPQPHVADQVAVVNRCGVLDTLLQFHADVRTQRITRQGAHDQWDARDLAYESLPVFDYTGARAGGVDEVQQLRFTDYMGGDTFNITLEGEVTDSIVYAAGDNSAAIQAALEALPNVGAGGCTVTLASPDVYQVTFIGENRASDLAEMAPRTISSDAGLVVAATTQQGKEGGEPIISDARGWPACGAFYQQRLWIGGLKSRPQTVLGSRLGDWFKFKTHGNSFAISGDLDTKENSLVRAIFPGQSLQIFTSSSEHWIAKEPIVPPPENKRAGGFGVAEGIGVEDIGDATVFVCAKGRALAECVWDDSRQKFASAYISKFATHLLAGKVGALRYVVDMGYRRAQDPDAADRAILVRDDGRAAVMHALRQDGVTGFVGWSTQGRILAAGSNLARVEYLIVERELGGGKVENLVERIDETAYLDCQVSRVVTPAEAAAGGLAEIAAPHLSGMAVDVYADGGDRGVRQAIGGVAAFEPPALRKVDAGLHFDAVIVTLPAVLEQDPRAGGDAEPQVGQVNLSLGPTQKGSLKLGLKGGHLYDVKFPQVETADQGPGENPFTGWVQVEAIEGFRDEAQVQIVQDRPGPLEIQQIVLTVDT